jgi:hypothetical protein
MCSAVVSTRISKKDRETLREAGIDVSLESRKHLQQIAAQIRRRKSLERLHRTIDKLMPSAAQGYASRSIREDRDSH